MPLPAPLVLEDDTATPMAVCEHYAGSPAKARKILGLWAAQAATGDPGFDITLDLEDGAAAAGLDATLGLIHELAAEVAQALRQSHRTTIPGLGVRLPSPQHPHFSPTLEALGRSPMAAVIERLTLPKVAGRPVLEHAIALIRDAARGGGCSALAERPLQVLVECHASLRDAFALAAHPRVSSLSFGIMDFVSAHRGALPAAAMGSPLQFTHPVMVRAKTEIVAACLAHGKVAVHNPSVHYSDPLQTQSDALEARSLGFQRMWSIHPAQIEPIVGAFAPSEQELVEAEEILSLAWDADWAPIAHQGRLHDRASYRYYWRLLRQAAPAKAAAFS